MHKIVSTCCIYDYNAMSTGLYYGKSNKASSQDNCIQYTNFNLYSIYSTYSTFLKLISR